MFGSLSLQLSLVEQKLVTVSSEEADSNGSLSELCGDLKQLIALTEGRTE